jgi:plasmid stabilization system protein ParE
MLSVAKEEFFEAVRYYNGQREGLGFEFAGEVKDALFRISGFPEAWPRLSERSRRCLLKRFPYAILYRFDNHQVLIVAIMHMSRDPKHWRKK